MDGGTFDHLTRRLAGRLTRRVGLAGALGALAGGKALDAAGRARERTRRHPGGSGARRHDAEVIDEKKPCGPTAAENKCRKDKDCCTNYCEPPKGNAKTGRCRCIKPSKKCKNGQTCCGGGTCQKGRCQEATCTVCESGCPFTSVNDAYAAAEPGATITIAAGTWTTGIIVDKDATLTACDDSGEVILQADGAVLALDSYSYVIVEDGVSSTPYTVTLDNLTLSGADSYTILLADYTIGAVSFVLTNVKGRNAGYFLAPIGGDHVLENCDTDASISSAFYGDFDSTGSGSITASNSTFISEDNTFYVDGNYAAADRSKTPFTLTNCTFTSVSGSGVNLSGGEATFTNCSITGSGDVGCYLDSGTVTFTDTTISGNSTTNDYAGGIYVWTDSYDSAVTLTGSTSVTGNTGTNVGGIGIYATNGAITVTGASTANVHDNTGVYQCASYDGSAWSNVANCAF